MLPLRPLDVGCWRVLIRNPIGMSLLRSLTLPARLWCVRHRVSIVERIAHERNPAVPTLSADVLLSFTRALFLAAGVPPEDAAIVAGSLVDANLCGHDSHGVIRIMQYVEFLLQDKLKPGLPLQI